MGVRDRGHYATIVALLRAAGCRARVYSNGEYEGVQIELEDAETALWGNQGKTWAYTEVDAEGVANGGVASTLEADAAPEDVVGYLLGYYGEVPGA